MLKILSLTIRKQMILLTVLMSIVPFGLICFSAFTQRNHEIREATTITTKVANEIQNEQKFLLAGIEQLATTLSMLPVIKSHDTAAVTHLLSEIQKNNRNYSNIFLVDKTGVLWASALPAERGLSFAERRYFKQAVASGKLSSGEFAISKIQQKPVFSFGYPVYNRTGNLEDVLIVTLALEDYQRYFSGQENNEVSSIMLTDHTGTILYSSTDSNLVGKQDIPDLFKRMVNGPDESSFSAYGHQNILRYFSYKKVRLEHEAEPYMYIRTGLSKEGVLARINKDFISSIAILSSVLFISIMIVLNVCKHSIYDKITAIRMATRRIARGDLDTRIGDSISGGELGELAHAFDVMAGQLAGDAINLARAHEAQRISERKYRELVENANSIILKWDRDGTITYFNEFAVKFFGYADSEIIGQSIIGTIVPETESSGRNLVDMMRKICDNPTAFINNENENIRKNGERVWVSWNNHPLTDSAGNIEGILSVGQDITERKIIEGKLQKSELRFRSFVENVNDVLFVLTPAGVFSYVSPQWKEAFGYELSETVGHLFTPFVHPDDVAGCFVFMQQILETGIKQSGVEYRVLCKSGLYKWYKANASLIVDPVNGSPAIVGIGRDITERKLAEESLRQSEEKYSAAFRASPDAVTLTRLIDGNYLEVNEGFTSMTGYSAEEALGKSSTELSLWVEPEQRIILIEGLKKYGIAKNVEARFRRKDGTDFVGQTSARIVTLKDEQYILSITRDITDQENIQHELIKAQKLESISILAGGIAHNFNNVLTGVIGYISYAKKHLNSPDKIRHILDSAESSSYRAAGLARQLLTFSQGSTPVRKSIAVDTLVQESVSLFLSGSNVKGTINCSSHQTIFVDSQQINQAFNNIVLNALQAMPNGGTLSVHASAVTIKAGNKFRLNPSTYVRIVFEDNGLGIDKNNLGKIFDPYFTTKESGTGLGLSTTHAIISKHGGSIIVESEVGKGTSVTVFLPTIVENEVIEASTHTTAQMDQTGAFVLVMDDDEMILELACDILGDLGYKVTTCQNGEEAVTLFKNSINTPNQFSVIILDLIVPGEMGGIEAAQRILELDSQARIIVSSGYTNNPAITDYSSFGFCGTIAKPYNVDEISKTLQNVLSGASNGNRELDN